MSFVLYPYHFSKNKNKMYRVEREYPKLTKGNLKGGEKHSLLL